LAVVRLGSWIDLRVGLFTTVRLYAWRALFAYETALAAAEKDAALTRLPALNYSAPRCSAAPGR